MNKTDGIKWNREPVMHLGQANVGNNNKINEAEYWTNFVAKNKNRHNGC